MSKKDRKNYPQSQNVKAHKAAAKAALAERLKQRERLVLVPESGDMQIYVKVMTVKEAYEADAQLQEFIQRGKDDREISLKKLSLILFDSEGDLYFDYENQGDRDALNALPERITSKLAAAHDKANEDDGLLKNLLAGGSSN